MIMLSVIAPLGLFQIVVLSESHHALKEKDMGSNSDTLIFYDFRLIIFNTEGNLKKIPLAFSRKCRLFFFNFP